MSGDLAELRAGIWFKGGFPGRIGFKVVGNARWFVSQKTRLRPQSWARAPIEVVDAISASRNEIVFQPAEGRV